MPLANKQKVIGFLGGMDIPVINDFKVGYEQGVKYIDPSIQVLVSYVGSCQDAAKGKELALAQYDQGADIGFNVAGQAGLGLLDAAKDKKRYAIGVDSDQYLHGQGQRPREGILHRDLHAEERRQLPLPGNQGHAGRDNQVRCGRGPGFQGRAASASRRMRTT